MRRPPTSARSPSQKTAALRMSLDAVERQQMPFVGETGGWGSGEDDRPTLARRAGPAMGPRPATSGRPRRLADRGGADLPPDRTGLPLDPGLAERLPRRGPAPRRTGITRSGAHRDPTRCSGDRRPDRCRGRGTRTSRTRRDRARLPAPRPAARPAHRRARRRVLRAGRSQGPRSRSSTLRVRRPGFATTRAALLRADCDRRGRRQRPDRRLARRRSSTALETQAAVLAGEAVPYLDLVRAMLRLRAAAPPRRRVRRAARASSTSSSRATGRCPTAWPPGTRALVVPPDRLPQRRRLAGRRASGRAPRPTVRPARRRGAAGLARPRPAVERLQLVRRRPAARGSTSTSTCRSGRRTSSTRSPTRPTRATISSTPGRRPTSSSAQGRLEALGPADQHARMPDQRGPGRPRHEVRGRRPTSEADLLVELFARAGLAVAARPGRRPRGGRASRGDRRRRDVTLGGHRAAMRPSCATPTGGRTTRSSPTCARSAAMRRTARRSGSSSSSTRSGGRTSSSTPRARRSSRAGSSGSRRPTGRRGSGGCSTSS